MNNRNLLLITLFLAIFASCSTKKEGGKFTVTGKIENGKSNRVALDKLSFESSPAQTIDTAIVGANGSFSLQGPADKEESVYRIVLDGDESRQWLFINDNKDMKVTLNGADMLRSVAHGSDATNELYKFLAQYSEKDSLLMHDLVQLDELQKKTARTKAEDSLVQALTADRQPKIDALNQTVQNFVQTAKSPAAVYFAIAALATRSIEPAELVKLASAAAQKHKEYKKLGELSSFLDTQVKAMSGGDEAYALEGKPAPDLEMQTPEGKNMKISDFRGKYLLVDFWASWCGPCRAENPNVVAAYNKFKNKNFTILGVSLDKDKTAWVKAVADDKLAWNQMSDLKYWESAAVTAYGFQGIPFNVLIDPAGKIIASNLRGQNLEAKLAEVLK